MEGTAKKLPRLHKLIASMISHDPSARPSASAVVENITDMLQEPSPRGGNQSESKLQNMEAKYMPDIMDRIHRTISKDQVVSAWDRWSFVRAEHGEIEGVRLSLFLSFRQRPGDSIKELGLQLQATLCALVEDDDYISSSYRCNRNGGTTKSTMVTLGLVFPPSYLDEEDEEPEGEKDYLQNLLGIHRNPNPSWGVGDDVDDDEEESEGEDDYLQKLFPSRTNPNPSWGVDDDVDDDDEEESEGEDDYLQKLFPSRRNPNPSWGVDDDVNDDVDDDVDDDDVDDDDDDDDDEEGLPADSFGKPLKPNSSW